MSAITPEMLAKVARLLGWESLYRSEVAACWVGDFDDMSDGELLLTVLQKAAEMGNAIELHFYDGLWFSEIYDPSELSEPLDLKVETPLEAALLAFAQLDTTP